MSETVTPNRKRLIHLAEWVGAQEARRRLGLSSEWGQESWIQRTECGTACCIAGKVALEDGGIPVVGEQTYDQDNDSWSWKASGLLETSYRTTAEMVIFGPDARLESAETVSDYAERVLGLTYGQADDLFNESNDFEDVVRIIGEILGADR